MIHRFCCCTEPVDLTCPSAGIHSGGCAGFAAAASDRWGMCITGESGGNAGLNKANPGYLLTRYAEGFYRCEEAGVRKVELDYVVDPAGANDSYVFRGYLWESGAWVLKRTVTITSAFANQPRINGYVSNVPTSGVTWKAWAIDNWVPDTVHVTIDPGTICTSCTSSQIYYDETFYWGKVSSISPALTAIGRYGISPSSFCMYEGHAGTCVFDLYDDFTDCENGENLTRQIVVPLMFQVYLSYLRQASVVVYTDVPGGSTVWQGDEDFGPALEWDRLGETLLFDDNIWTCADWPVVISESGTITVIIPPHG